MADDIVAVQDKLKHIQQALVTGLHELAKEIVDEFEGYIEEGFNTGHATGPSGSPKLYAGDGTLPRSFLPGQPGSATSIEVTERGVKIQIGTTVAYARVHEMGGFIASHGKMAGKMWALFRSTHEEFYRALAIHVRRAGGITLPPRPFFAPAVAMMKNNAAALIAKRLRTIITTAANAR